jgi:NADPH2:quinone reductase
MRAVGYRTPSPIDAPDALVDIDLPDPVPGPRDLLVEVKAIAVNPVDYKIRRGTPPPEGSEWRVLGWDAAGIVQAVGSDVTLFAPGDAVFHAGALGRQGTNAELHVVDERLVGRKPETLGWAEAAALPLTAVTAWEALFDRMDVRRPVPGAANALLIVGAGGGVGSIAVQLARQLTDLTVIGTASRPETRAWVEALGAHHVVDHARGLAAGVAALGIGAPACAFSTTHTDQHFADLVELIAPQGRILLIDDPETLDVMALKRKSVSLHHELMFTRSTFGTPDMGEQGRLLNEVARLVDAGTLRTTLGAHGGRIDAANLLRAHRTLEAGTARGKIVLEGFGG